MAPGEGRQYRLFFFHTRQLLHYWLRRPRRTSFINEAKRCLTFTPKSQNWKYYCGDFYRSRTYAINFTNRHRIRKPTRLLDIGRKGSWTFATQVWLGEVLEEELSWEDFRSGLPDDFSKLSSFFGQWQKVNGFAASDPETTREIPRNHDIGIRILKSCDQERSVCPTARSLSGTNPLHRRGYLLLKAWIPYSLALMSPLFNAL